MCPDGRLEGLLSMIIVESARAPVLDEEGERAGPEGCKIANGW